MINEDLLYNEVLSLFLDKGVRFTMDELADSLGVSKRTLYEKVSSKEQLAYFMVEKYFDEVSARQHKIYTDKNLETVERLKNLLTAMPVTILDRHRLIDLKREFPAVYDEINLKLSHGWEKIFNVLHEAQEEKLIGEVDENIFKIVYVSSVEAMLFGYDTRQETSFSQMQRKMVDMLFNGLLIR